MGMPEGKSPSTRRERCKGEMALLCFCEIANSGKQKEKKKEKKEPRLVQPTASL